VKDSEILDLMRNMNLDLNELVKSESERKLAIIENFVDVMLKKEDTKNHFIEVASEYLRYYKSVLPDPRMNDYKDRVSAVRVLKTRLDSMSGGDIDLTDVQRDLEELLDRSIKAGEFKFPAYVKLKDLSDIDAEKLKELFESNSNKIVQSKELTKELKSKINDLVKINKSRESFMTRLQKKLDEYNNGDLSIDDLLEGLILIARDLNQEEFRAASEGLTETELALFDILRKEELSSDELRLVKATSRELLESIRDKLVPGWREFDPLRSGVKIAINNVIYPRLPENHYPESECGRLSGEIYRYVYERFPDSTKLLAV
jgi:type I restriction enzyme R subunit